MKDIFAYLIGESYLIMISKLDEFETIANVNRPSPG